MLASACVVELRRPRVATWEAMPPRARWNSSTLRGQPALNGGQPFAGRRDRLIDRRAGLAEIGDHVRQFVAQPVAGPGERSDGGLGAARDRFPQRRARLLDLLGQTLQQSVERFARALRCVFGDGREAPRSSSRLPPATDPRARSGRAPGRRRFRSPPRPAPPCAGSGSRPAPPFDGRASGRRARPPRRSASRRSRPVRPERPPTRPPCRRRGDAACRPGKRSRPQARRRAPPSSNSASAAVFASDSLMSWIRAGQPLVDHPGAAIWRRPPDP